MARHREVGTLSYCTDGQELRHPSLRCSAPDFVTRDLGVNPQEYTPCREHSHVACSPRPFLVDRRSFGFLPTLHGDDDLSSSVSLSKVPYRFGNLTQRVLPVNDRLDLPGFQELLQKSQVLLAALRDKRNQLLPHKARHHGRGDKGKNRYLLPA